MRMLSYVAGCLWWLAGCQPLPGQSPSSDDDTSDSATDGSDDDGLDGSDSVGDTTGGLDTDTDTDTDGISELCGNRQPDPGEICDDGNNEDGDGCNADCTEATCWVPASHPTIQAAVDDPGCPTVWLALGVHHEHVVVERDLELVGGTISGDLQGRVLEIARGVSVVVRDTHIMQGSAELGGGIYSLGTLELDHVRVTGNDAEGGQSCGGGIWSDGTVILRSTEVSGNESKTPSADAHGAGVCMVGGRLELHGGSEIRNNSARAEGEHSARGGGVHAQGTEIVIATGSRCSSNTAIVDDANPGATASGALIHQVGGTLVVQNAWLSSGRARVEGDGSIGSSVLAQGGGLSLLGVDAHISDSLLYDDLASAGGGGGLLRGRGGALYLSGGSTVTLDRNVFDFNRASAVTHVEGMESVVLGGAVDIEADGEPVTLDIVDCTFTVSRATTYSLVDGDESPLYSAGGVIHAVATAPGGSVTIRAERSTFYDNRADHGGVVFLVADDVGANIGLDLVNDTIYDNEGDMGAVLGASATGGDIDVRVRSTTISRNDGDVSGGLWVTPLSSVAIDVANTVLVDNGLLCGPSNAMINSLGYNALDSADCGIFPGPGDMLVDEGAGLELLGDNGGPTETCALELPSPLRNAGDPGGCVDAEGSPLLVDQRGEPREMDGRCDIGAFESVP